MNWASYAIPLKSCLINNINFLYLFRISFGPSILFMSAKRSVFWKLLLRFFFTKTREWLSGLRCNIGIRRMSVQTLLLTQKCSKMCPKLFIWAKYEFFLKVQTVTFFFNHQLMPVIRYNSENCNVKVQRKLQKYWFWAQKWLIYPILSIVWIFLANSKQSLLPIHWCLSSI